MPESLQVTDAENDKLQTLAACVINNEHLMRILREAEPRLRKAVYKVLRPHLKFKPKPYFILSKAWTN